MAAEPSSKKKAKKTATVPEAVAESAPAKPAKPAKVGTTDARLKASRCVPRNGREQAGTLPASTRTIKGHAREGR